MGRFDLRGLELVSPRLLLEGEGHISIVGEDPIPDSPLTASVAIATRDDMTTLFDGMGMLVEEPDANGYRKIKKQQARQGK